MSTEKAQKKKLIQIEMSPEYAKASGSGYSTTYDDYLYYGFVSPMSVEKDGRRVRYQVTDLGTCRDSLCEKPKAFLNKDLHSTWLKNMGPHSLDFEALRLLMLTGCSVEKAKPGLFAAKRAMNILEKEAGWKPSVITTVKYVPNSKASGFLLTGDYRWIHAPQMLSLAAMLMRIGFRGADLEATALPELMKKFKTFAESGANDATYLKCCYEHLMPLMKNLLKIFPGDRSLYYPADSTKGFRGHGGVYTLFQTLKKKSTAEYDGTGNLALEDRLRKYILNK